MGCLLLRELHAHRNYLKLIVTLEANVGHVSVDHTRLLPRTSLNLSLACSLACSRPVPGLFPGLFTDLFAGVLPGVIDVFPEH